jgi:hypothetical protein
MQYLVEIRLADSERSTTPGEGPAFVEQYVLPTLEICQQLEAERRIIAGGPINGMGLAFIIRAESAREVDDIVANLPLGPRMVTTVTPLSTWADRGLMLGPRLQRPRQASIPGHVLVK